MKFSIWGLLSAAFIIYMLHSLYGIYQLFNPELCNSAKSSQCLKPALSLHSFRHAQLRFYVSLSSSSSSNLKEVFRVADFDLMSEFSSTVEIHLPERTRKNGSLYLHVFLMPQTAVENPFHSKWYVLRSHPLTHYAVPSAQIINLVDFLSSKNKTEERKYAQSKTSSAMTVPTSHMRTVLVFRGLESPVSFEWKKIPPEVVHLLVLDEGRNYLPVFYLDTLSFRSKDSVQISDEMREVNVSLKYMPCSIGKIRLLMNAQQSLEKMKELGFTDNDIEEVRGIFTDTNFYLLAVTFFVASIHILLDFLAFKNDISFWKGRKNMVGLSSRTVVWRCFSQAVIFMYLLDENTSLLVLIPTAIGVVIELWKVTKAFKVELTLTQRMFPRFRLGVSNREELETERFDSEGMTYVAWLLFPLCIAGSAYSLVYVPHRSWYSWIIQNIANGVYAFGFLFMLPQLFVNYKLKSVAHLPWRAFMYKAFNTFIDDLFAFIITMPTAHRLACFRDDVIFVIYLYQRWLYPVDKSRINEFGESFEHELSTKSDPKEDSKKSR
ncbi:unnamed protein product [Soboliphyme baturini]|uniref:Lipid scramblase CLPTM1L n=1 Tax=Soboliphyme baturini TaxID=241478 RepID=A0A183IP81_9BILA|nr:unnamed protein product [Soboliphyme baturini]